MSLMALPICHSRSAANRENRAWSDVTVAEAVAVTLIEFGQIGRAAASALKSVISVSAASPLAPGAAAPIATSPPVPGEDFRQGRHHCHELAELTRIIAARHSRESDRCTREALIFSSCANAALSCAILAH
jgi:hypothetical protein